MALTDNAILLFKVVRAALVVLALLQNAEVLPVRELPALFVHAPRQHVPNLCRLVSFAHYGVFNLFLLKFIDF